MTLTYKFIAIISLFSTLSISSTFNDKGEVLSSCATTYSLHTSPTHHSWLCTMNCIAYSCSQTCTFCTFPAPSYGLILGQPRPHRHPQLSHVRLPTVANHSCIHPPVDRPHTFPYGNSRVTRIKSQGIQHRCKMSCNIHSVLPPGYHHGTPTSYVALVDQEARWVRRTLYAAYVHVLRSTYLPNVPRVMLMRSRTGTVYFPCESPIRDRFILLKI